MVGKQFATAHSIFSLINFPVFLFCFALKVDKGVKKYVCLWDGCKWFNTPSSSRSWLFKHVLPHCGDKPFRCLLAGCLMSFPTESGQLRHVQTHLSEQAVQKTPRSKEDSPGRMMKKKRLKFKRRFSQGIIRQMRLARWKSYYFYYVFLVINQRNQASESTQLRVTRVFFLPLLSHNFDYQLSSNFHRFVILCTCCDTP